MTSPKINFVASSVPYAWFIHDSDGRLVSGSVTQTAGGNFAYQRGRWDGKRQVFDHLRAEKLETLGQKIEAYLDSSLSPHQTSG